MKDSIVEHLLLELEKMSYDLECEGTDHLLEAVELNTNVLISVLEYIREKL